MLSLGLDNMFINVYFTKNCLGSDSSGLTKQANIYLYDNDQIEKRPEVARNNRLPQFQPQSLGYRKKA
jgi:hypothetical protein